MTHVAGTVAASCLLVGLSLTGCGDDGGDDGSDTGTGRDSRSDAVEPVVIDADPADVTALDNSFDAQVVKVAPGTTVRWTNKGRQDHDVIPAEGGSWGAEVDDFHPGDVYEHTFVEPGTYDYYCTIHGTSDRGMIGTVIVE